jgi:uncharacterized protein (DUF934 family)
MRNLVTASGVAPDPWRYLGEVEAGSAAEQLIVPWDELQKAPQEFTARAGRLGALVAPDTDWRVLQPLLSRLDLVAVRFPAFGEGRGYSLARQLRVRAGFGGELRAVGQVFRDHVPFLVRSGFTSLEVAQREDPAAAFAALRTFSVAYQPSIGADPTGAALRAG